MTRSALYVVGAPGSGKTTLVEAMTAGWEQVPRATDPLPNVVFPEAAVVELGKRREGGFSGTDALSMSAITKAEPLVRHPWPLAPDGRDWNLLAEGDRLAVDRFFSALLESGWEIEIAWLNTPEFVQEERRAARGSTQNEAWVRGRQTKVQKLVDRWFPYVVELSGDTTTEEALAKLREQSWVAQRFVR